MAQDSVTETKQGRLQLKLFNQCVNIGGYIVITEADKI